MSRFFFHILNDPGTGLEFDTSIAVGDLSADLDGSPSGLSFTQVNDGYYFEYTVSGQYTIKISGVAQDEFTTIPLIAIEDNVTTAMLQSVKGYIYSSGGYLRVYTDGSSAILHAGDVVNDLTTGGAAVPLSAAQGVALKALIDTINNRFSAGEDINLGGVGDIETIETLWQGPVAIADNSDGGSTGDGYDKESHNWQTTSEAVEEKLAFTWVKKRNRNSIILQATTAAIGTPGASTGHVILDVYGNISGEQDVITSIELLDTHGDIQLVADISQMTEGEGVYIQVGLKVKSGETDPFGLQMANLMLQASSFKVAKAKNILYKKVAQ